jgi:hypothetical protein
MSDQVDLANLQASRDRIIAELSVVPLGPDYDMDGQREDLTAYRSSLLTELAVASQELNTPPDSVVNRGPHTPAPRWRETYWRSPYFRR